MVSPRRPRATRRATGLGTLVLGVVLGCNPANTPDTNVPSPDEDREDLSIGATTDPTAAATDPDLAAKQAAAQQVLEHVKDRDPEEEKKKLARSHAISQQARDKLARGQNSEAVQTAREALKVHEQNVDAMLVIAEVYYKEGKFELVRAVTSSALQIDAKIRTPEESSRAYNLQGFAMLAMGETTTATQSFKKAAEVDETNAAAWNNLGTRYLDAGDVATSLACFKYALELDPRFPKAHLNYGAALRANHQWEEAEAELRKSLELRPSYAEAYFNLGVLYLDADPFPGLDTTQRLNKAIQNLTKYRELAIADSGERPGPGARAAAGAAKAPPPRVSKDRADDFIRVAKKGLEREARRLEREKERGAQPATPTDGGGGAEPAEAPGGDTEPTEAVDPASPPDGGDPSSPGDSPAPQGPTKPAPQGPTKPTPQGPTKPAPQGPSSPTPQGPSSPSGPDAPSQPAPQGPTTPTQPAPTKPAPQGPTTPTQPAPTKPAPQGPAAPTPTKPAPQGPSAPTQPAPTQPAPQGPTAPAPVKPAPQGPTSPPPGAPSPQKPSVQKPQSSHLRLPSLPKKVRPDSPWRGTRFAASTLSSMELGATAMYCRWWVGLVSVPPTKSDAPIPPRSASNDPLVLDRMPTRATTSALLAEPELPLRARSSSRSA